MYKKMHLQMTLFSTLITGLILVFMTIVCLIIAENNLTQSYSSELALVGNTITRTLETKNILTGQELIQISDNNYILQIYDNGEDLIYNKLQANTYSEVIQSSLKMIQNNYGIELDSKATLIADTEQITFSIKDSQSNKYTGIFIHVPKNNGFVSAIILQPQYPLEQRILQQRRSFIVTDLIAFILLGLFSWFFTRHLIRPIEIANKKQNQFIADASHELRSPLTVILAGLSAIKSAPEAERNRFITSMENEGQRMSRLIEDMLAIARTDNRKWTLKSASCDADTILLNIYEQFQNIANEKQRTLHIDLPQKILPKIFCDVQRIEQILSIFINNALSYTHVNGNIWLNLKTTSSHLQLIVADDGPGIADNHKEKIFDRFYRVDASHHSKEHFGLGLSIAKDIASLHNGTIYVKDSKEMGYAPTGACFILELPITQRAAE